MDEDLQLDAVPLVLGHWDPQLGHVVTFADLLAATPYDAEDRPPAGTECAQCRQFGHWCPAKGYCGEYALCLPCGAGIACEQLAAVDRVHQVHMGTIEEELFVPDGFAASSVGRTIEICDADRIVVERQLVTAWTAKASLDPENLRKGLKRAARLPGVPTKKEVAEARSLEKRIARANRGPRKRLRVAKVKVVVEKVEEKKMPIVSEKVCKCGCGESYIPSGNAQRFKDGHKPVKAETAGGGRPKKLKPVKKPKAAAALSVIAPAVDTVEMVTVQVPASALDKLILMLPAKLKASAIEKLLGELA